MCAGTSGKYLVEQGLNIFKFSKQHKFFWSNLANKLRKSNVILGLYSGNLRKLLFANVDVT